MIREATATHDLPGYSTIPKPDIPGGMNPFLADAFVR